MEVCNYIHLISVVPTYALEEDYLVIKLVHKWEEGKGIAVIVIPVRATRLACFNHQLKSIGSVSCSISRAEYVHYLSQLPVNSAHSLLQSTPTVSLYSQGFQSHN